MIVHEKDGFYVKSADGSKNLGGPYASEDLAKKRLMEVEAHKTDGVFRLDAGKLGSIARAPDGGIKIQAFVTRTGVLSYTRADGSVSRELRHPDHVFAEDSLKSLDDVALTDLHPGRMDAASYRKHTIGHVRSPEKAGQFVKASIAVKDATAIDRIDRGERKEISCGYTCDVVTSAGVFEGEKYDSIQTNIRYNHVALGPANWGRAGNSVALHLDSNDDSVILETHLDSPEEDHMDFENIDGIQYKVGSAEHSQALRKARTDAVARADAADALVKSEKARADKAEGERDAARADAKTAADRMDAAVDARIELHTTARKHLGKDWKSDGKSDRQVMIDVITKSAPEFKADDKTSGEYILGRFQGLSVPKDDSLARVRKDAETARTETGAAKKSPDQVRKDNRLAAAEAWKLPLTVSRK